ncbi:hypothetical protein LTSEMIN_4001 [Salmonella enterica subsp. enterica serovar Minnesota str. A4-603]|nr:hypothetical protein LTSEMIN_4001 [Salmonella enterica subsp. enterica serovar Minnesota str. A4-603]
MLTLAGLDALEMLTLAGLEGWTPCDKHFPVGATFNRPDEANLSIENRV